MNTSFAVIVIVSAVLTGTSEAGSPVAPFESDAEPKSHGRIDELVAAKLKQLGLAPANMCSDAVFLRRAYLDVSGTLPTADEARQFLEDQRPRQTPEAGRSAVGERRVRRLLDDEVVRSAAGQVGVPHQSVAQCGAGVPSLDSDLRQGEHAVRPVRPRVADRQRQQFPHAAGEFLSRGSEPRAAGHGPSRGADVHGSPARKLAPGAVVGDGGLLLADGLQAHDRVEGGDRPVRSREGRQRRPPPRRCRRLRSRMARPPSYPRARTLARPLPAGCWPPEPVVRPKHGQPRLVLAAGPRHRRPAGRHPAGQPAQQSRVARLPGANW